MKRGLLAAVALGALAIEPSVVLAQTAEVAPAGDGLGDIIVTARKRDESLQSTPVAVSAFSGETLERQVALSLQDVSSKVPGLVFEPVSIYRNASAIYIRGSGYQDVENAYEPAVATVVDGVYLGRSEGALFGLYDTAQVEVLRGPQGTLFGKNTIGGVIQYTSRKPTGVPEFRGNVIVGNYGRADFRAGVDFPIVADKIFATLAFASRNSDGVIRNAFDNTRLQNDKSIAARLAVRFLPTETIDYTIIAEINRDRGGSVGNQNASLPTDLIAVRYGELGSLVRDPFTVRHDTPSVNEFNGFALTGNGTLDLGPATLTSITGYRHADDLINIDVDATALDFFSNRDRTTDYSQFSQELRLTSNDGAGLDFDRKIDWVFGLFYFRNEYDLSQIFSGLLGPFGTGRIQANGQVAKSYAAYGQVNVNISDSLRLTAGARYTHEAKTFYSQFGYPIAGPEPTPYEQSAKFNNTSFRLGFDYRFTPDVMAYFTFSQGYRAGGFNSRAAKPSEVGPYNPEKLNSYEAGFKTTFLDNRARLNVAAYYNDYRDMLVTTIQPDTVQGTKTLTSNAGAATIKGIEVEASFRPIRALTLSGWVSYMDAKYDELTANLTGSGVADFTYLRLQRTPKWETNLAINYAMPLRSLNGELVTDASWSTRSNYFLEALNRPLSLVDNYSVVNASIEWVPDHGRYTFGVWAKNLTDRVYRSGASYVGGLNTFVVYGDPRTYGVRATVKFGG